VQTHLDVCFSQLDLSGIMRPQYCQLSESDPAIQEMAKGIEKLLPSMALLDPEQRWRGNEDHPGYKEQMEKMGVIAESFINEGNIIGSPSVQAIVGNGACDIISTHDQILQNQIYEGCRFPAAKQYRSTIISYGERVGEFLAGKGVTGHFSLDFLAVEIPSETGMDNDVKCYAIEINLRQCGTTHPFALLQLLTGGKTNEEGSFITSGGDERFYIATDTIFCPNLVGVTEGAFLRTIQRSEEQFKWNQVRESGTVFHMLSSVAEFGKGKLLLR
jgi:hypothetical protein